MEPTKFVLMLTLSLTLLGVAASLYALKLARSNARSWRQVRRRQGRQHARVMASLGFVHLSLNRLLIRGVDGSADLEK